MTPAARLAGLLGTGGFDRGFVLVDREDGTVTVGLGEDRGPGPGRPGVRVLPFDPVDPREAGPWAPLPPLRPRRVATFSRPGAAPRWSGPPGAPAVPDGPPPPLPLPGRLELPPVERVVRRVREALEAVRAGTLEKVVPSCTGRLVFPEVPAPGALAARLLAAGTVPDGRTRFALLAGERLLVGATPERLFRLDPGGTVRTEALAGTGSPGGEHRLRASPKDRLEHDLVVREIRRRLAPVVDGLCIPAEPALRAVPGLVHLHTPIEGHLRPGTDPGDLLAALHPTPAVAGTPREAALAWLREREAPRGMFAAPLLVEGGGGALEAVVVLRAAVLAGNVLHLRAGAGIVAGSDPEREAEEILAKLRASVAGLGLPLPGGGGAP